MDNIICKTRSVSMSPLLAAAAMGFLRRISLGYLCDVLSRIGFHDSLIGFASNRRRAPSLDAWMAVRAQTRIAAS